MLTEPRISYRCVTLMTSELFSSIPLIDLIDEELTMPPNLELPSDLESRLSRGFNYGTAVQWIPETGDTAPPDFGIVIGKFLSYAPHTSDWGICHLIWLDIKSPSRAWTQTDIAWMEDLTEI